jgi:hypothetical protein
MVAEVMDIIEKGSGVTELLYGSTSRQMRSSAEAQLLGGNASIRPDDMAEKTDSWYALAALKEWQTAVWLLDAADVVDVVGPAGAWLFQTHIVTEEFSSVAYNYTFRLVAGSAQKPNKANRIDKLLKFGQAATPYWQQLLQLGQPQPYNRFMREFAKALDIEDWEEFTVTDEQLQQMIMQMQQAQQQESEAALREEEHQQKLQHREQENEQKLMWNAAGNQQKIESDAASLQIKAMEELFEAVTGAA